MGSEKKSCNNNPRWVVLKFGGTSVSTLDCWKTIKGIINDRCAQGLRPVVVCSALSGVSDLLEELIKKSLEIKHKEVLFEIERVHADFAKSLGVEFKNIEDELLMLNNLATGISLVKDVSPKVHAQILSLGEIMLTKLAWHYLEKSGMAVGWHDARKCLISEPKEINKRRSLLSASCAYGADEKLRDLFAKEKSEIILTQGFIASNPEGETVLLGRGGSDVSGSYFAAKLCAERSEIWTDVPGMYTANPREVSSARLIKKIDYDEAQEIASTGAKVLHPRCIGPAKKSNIPLYVYSLSAPHLEGTCISSKKEKMHASVKAISSKRNVILISMESIEMWHQAGFLADIFKCFKEHGLSIDLVSTSESNVTVTLDSQINTLDKHALKNLVNDLSLFCKVEIVDSCALVSLVGRNIRSILHQLAPALKLFEEQKIYLVSQAANDLNLTFVVDDSQVQRLVLKIHEELFKDSQLTDVLGPTWQETFGEKIKQSFVNASFWWVEKKNKLLELASEKTPLYVYDEETIGEKIKSLCALTSVDQLFYAIKANSNPEVLQKCATSGLGFECVSIEEVKYTKKIIPDLDSKKILFTPNFVSEDEYKSAFNEGVNVTLDNVYPLETWSEIFANQRLFLRIDPGQGKGHHKYVHTAGSKSKFGISISEIDKVCALVAKHNLKVIGLHAHVGSNIFSADTWKETGLCLAEISKRFPDVRVLDVGGGFGVVEKAGQAPLDLKAVDSALATIKVQYPKLKIWIEPGRYIIANAGVLLARVTQTKNKNEYYYVGINAGMNSLIRPALYGSYHEIVNLTQMDEENMVKADIVGPICESGDILGSSRMIASPKDGDIILIDTVGAYGRVMSSRYNMREPAEEIYLKV